MTSWATTDTGLNTTPKVTPETARQAALTCAAHSTDPDDLKALLTMLGLK